MATQRDGEHGTEQDHGQRHGEDRWSDPAYRAGVVDLLGALAYGELSAFARLATDSELAPTMASRMQMARLGALEFSHHELLRARLGELGVGVEEAMAPFVTALDGFHERTEPSSWHEALVKYFVGDSIASDFYREVAAFLDDDTRALVMGALDTPGKTEFVVEEVLTATAADPVLASRLALWGRRLMGEALSQSQRVAADRDALQRLMVNPGSTAGMGLVEIVEIFGRLTQRHTDRMAQLGLES